MANITDVVGCVPLDSGVVFCPDCCPAPNSCEDEHGAIFVGSEWDCAPPSCDACHNVIEEVRIIHYQQD